MAAALGGRQATSARTAGQHMATLGNIAGTGDVEAVYRIGELASEFGVTLRTLRFYEDKGLLVPRRIGNTRLYSRRDRGRLTLIVLGRRLGFSLRDIGELLDLYDPADGNRRQLQSAARKGARQLASLYDQRAALDASIAELERHLDEARRRLSALDRG